VADDRSFRPARNPIAALPVPQLFSAGCPGRHFRYFPLVQFRFISLIVAEKDPSRELDELA
jgi:hypothetical protein